MAHSGIRSIVSLLCFSLLFCTGSITDSSDGRGELPDWRERTVYVLINAARLDPQNFSETYISNNPLSTFEPRAPLIMHHDLNRAARFHSEDMAACQTMSHTSCDGTSFNDRLRSFIGRSGGECVASGYSTPIIAINGWLNSTGHRDILMGTNYTDVGCGHAISNRHYWTVNTARLNSTQTHPVFGATHLLLRNNRTDFWLNYYSPSVSPPRSVDLILQNQRIELVRIMGEAGRGTYGVDLPTVSECREYYFEIEDGDGISWRYPEKGVLRTYGAGECM